MLKLVTTVERAVILNVSGVLDCLLGKILGLTVFVDLIVAHIAATANRSHK